MKLLVTGGAGFIGSNFILYMLKKYPNDTIINLDTLTYAGNLENLKNVQDHNQYEFLNGDITDLDFVYSIFEEGIDAVINFAAESHVDRSISDPSIFVKTNVQGTQVLLDTARKFRVGKFLQVSTDEVYGSLGKIGLFHETTPLAPNSPYSASKASADHLVYAYYKTYGLPINITRCSNNYGPYQFPEKLIPLMIINALQNKPLPLYGDGLNVRDWLHVDDHCQAIDLVLRNGKVGEVYNIGGNNEQTNVSIVEKILTKLERPKSLITYVQDRMGHDRRYAIDASKIRSELGWSPNYRFEVGIEQTIEWYINNQPWWERILSGEYKDYYYKNYNKH
ncbi:dTDP-glucose 4,6-dehydratase [Metabacillus halosaccharovorans]|uniref:dTDP-glucose 4,6-dehydratase n=1 Tax=Metabacillus halosaccharovorans TaxID=930124 RepID=UPI0034CFFD1F